VVFVAAMWVLIALVGLVLVMARWARVEANATANRTAALEASMAARGGEQYVLSLVEEALGDASYFDESPAEQVPVGLSAFWIVRPDRNAEGVLAMGVDDEGGKINVNTASRETLLKLPGMTADVAEAIIDWRDPDENPGANGAESAAYQAYRCKNGPFESLEELLLVRGVTPELFYGSDANRNGVIDPEENGSSGVIGGGTSSAGGTRVVGSTPASPVGIRPFVTIYGTGAAPQGQQQATNVNGNAGAVLELLKSNLSADRFNEVLPRVQSGRPFRNVLDFYVKTALTPDEFGLIADRLSTGGQANAAAVNVNTAPAEVLRCLPGLEEADVKALVAARANGADTSNLAWVAAAIDKGKAVTLGDAIVGRSYRYGADVVGVSGDGRAFHRVRVVVNASQSPPRVVYRRDLTQEGWPLEWELRESLRMSGMAGGAAGVMQ
jgi:DNA uptake protein ComE-like DNA-binding protein